MGAGVANAYKYFYLFKIDCKFDNICLLKFFLYTIVLNVFVAVGVDLMRSLPNGHICHENGYSFWMWNIVCLNDSSDQRWQNLWFTRLSFATHEVRIAKDVIPLMHFKGGTVNMSLNCLNVLWWMSRFIEESWSLI